MPLRHMKKHILLILLLGLIGSLLVCLRVVATLTDAYAFLLWNLFLAYLPLGFAILFAQTKTKWFKYLNFFLWLIFYPNSIYILTDFIHLNFSNNSWYLFDLGLVLLFSILGLLAGIVSLDIILTTVRLKYGRKIALDILVIVSVLTGFGIFLGRILRFNSWDLLVRPLELFQLTLDALTLNYLLLVMVAITLIFASINIVSYLLYSKVKHNFLYKNTKRLRITALWPKLTLLKNN